MRRCLLSVVGAVALAQSAVAQSFTSVLQRAEAADRAKQHLQAATLYEQAYALSGFDPFGLALAARSAAAGGGKATALRDMGKAIDQGYLDQRLLADSAFNALRRDPQWTALVKRMQTRLDAVNAPIRAELIKLAEQDQQNRSDFGALMKRVEQNSPDLATAMRVFNTADSAIQFRVREIITQIGWPTRSKVGDDGAHAAWLVVQHMPKEDQERYLPMLLAAVKAGEAQAGDGALLQDRVLVRQGKKQLYGSQLSVTKGVQKPTLDSIANEPCVNQRRKAVGLEPLQDYLVRYDIVYKPVGTCGRG